jgi:hypothetical protein
MHSSFVWKKNSAFFAALVVSTTYISFLAPKVPSRKIVWHETQKSMGHIMHTAHTINKNGWYFSDRVRCYFWATFKKSGMISYLLSTWSLVGSSSPSWTSRHWKDRSGCSMCRWIPPPLRWWRMTLGMKTTMAGGVDQYHGGQEEAVHDEGDHMVMDCVK